MITKTVLATGVAAGMLVVAAPFAFAQTDGTNASTTAHTSTIVVDATKLACVGAAVNARESALDAAIATHSSAVVAAYNARATALSAAYSKTTAKDVRAAVKAAWKDFNSAIRSAQKAWRTARDAAWKTFRTAVRACKAPSSVSDGGNSGLEASGN
jgi:hypothetical protein